MHPFSNATDYPGAAQMAMKLLFDPEGKAKARGTLQGCVSADKLGDNRACGTAPPASAS